MSLATEALHETRLHFCHFPAETYASIPQDTAEHSRRELVAFCPGCWHFTGFLHNKGTIAALELINKLKIDAHRTASGTQGRLRGALTSQEIAKYTIHEIMSQLL